MLGLLEAANRAFQEMKNAKDVLFLDAEIRSTKKREEKLTDYFPMAFLAAISMSLDLMVLLPE